MGAMGAVSSMMQSHVSYPDRANIEVSTRFRKGTPGSGRLLSESSQGSQTPSSKRRNVSDRAQGFGTRSNSHQDLIRDWTHNHLCVDAPPRLVPVSGQGETPGTLTTSSMGLMLLLLKACRMISTAS